MRISDWSSDVCSSALVRARQRRLPPLHRLRLARRPARVERARRRGGDDAGSGAAADARHRDRDLLPLDDARRPRARTLYGGPGVARQSVVSGTSVTIRLYLGGRTLIKKKNKQQ